MFKLNMDLLFVALLISMNLEVLFEGHDITLINYCYLSLHVDQVFIFDNLKIKYHTYLGLQDTPMFLITETIMQTDRFLEKTAVDAPGL